MNGWQLGKLRRVAKGRDRRLSHGRRLVESSESLARPTNLRRCNDVEPFHSRRHRLSA